MRKNYYLFIDETGVPSIRSPHPYILTGCIVPVHNMQTIQIKADQVRFKYWNRTRNIVFHSVDIAKFNPPFDIFKKDIKNFKSFQKDLFHFLNSSSFEVMSVLIDKQAAKIKGWTTNEKLIYETAYRLIENYITLLAVRGSKGKIFIESSADKDPQYLKSFNHFLSNGIPNMGLNHADVKNYITSISFVTKQNNDIETQIADLLSYGAKCKFNKSQGSIFPTDSYEDKILKLYDKKSRFTVPQMSKEKKNKLKKVKSLVFLP